MIEAGRTIQDQSPQGLGEVASHATERLTTRLPGFGGHSWEGLFPVYREMRGNLFALGEMRARLHGLPALDFEDFDAILQVASSDRAFFYSLAGRFCRRLDDNISKVLGFELELTFAGFAPFTQASGTTDNILATLPIRSARVLVERSANEGHQRLINTICDLFIYRGIVPPSAHLLNQLLARPVERWDRYQLCHLLASFAAPDIDLRLYAEMILSDEVELAFKDSVDWKMFSSLLADRRHGKVRRTRESLLREIRQPQ